MNFFHGPLSRWGLRQIETGPEDSILDAGCGGGANVARLLKAAPRGRSAAWTSRRPAWRWPARSTGAPSRRDGRQSISRDASGLVVKGCVPA
jgi:hypothetical protein